MTTANTTVAKPRTIDRRRVTPEEEDQREIKALYGRRTGLPGAPGDGQFPPAHSIEPSPERLRAIMDCNGGSEERARHSLIASTRAQYQTLLKAGCGVAAAVAEAFEEAERIRLAAGAELVRAAGQLNDLQNKLKERGDLVKRIAGVKADLEHAQKTLDDPASLNLDGATLALLGTKRQHLPAELALLERGVAPLDEEIKRLAGELQIDLETLIRQTYGEANEFQFGGYRDSHFKMLFEGGFLQIQ